MSKPRKVSLSRGIKPAAVEQQEQELYNALQGKEIPVIEPKVEEPKVEEPKEISIDEKPDGLPTVEIPVATPPVKPPRQEPLGNLTLIGEQVDFHLKYLDVNENDFSVMFVLPQDIDLNANLKQAGVFTLECPHVSRQKVVFVGTPFRFEKANINLFFLLKDDGKA